MLSVFHISSNNFNITIVLLKANPTHIYHDVIISSHKNIDIANQMIAVMITWKDHAIIEVFQISFIIFG